MARRAAVLHAATADQEHAVLLTVDPDGTERVLLDPMALDPSGLTTLDAWQPTKEGHLLAYQLSEGGTEESVLRVMDVVTGEVVDGPIDRARYSPVAWLPGAEAYYYVRRLAPELVPAGEEQFHRRVWLHRVGTDPAEDVLVFGEGRRHTEYYGVSVSRDGRWLQVSASEGTAPRNDLWLADLPGRRRSRPRPACVQDDVDAQTGLEVGRDGRLYVFTDRDAPRGRLCVTTPDRPDATTLGRTSSPRTPRRCSTASPILDGAELERAGAARVVDPARGRPRSPSTTWRPGERSATSRCPGSASVGGIVERPEGGHEAWFGYTDHTTPSTRPALRRAAPARPRCGRPRPGTVEVPAVTTQQVTYTSADGTDGADVRASPRRPDAGDLGRPRPTILYGYGGFGLPLTPGYSATVLAWVEAGGVYAVANLRGGGEEGEDWHRAGMLGHKQNVFDDFHAAAEWLVADGWTTARPARRSTAAPTAACSSAPRSPSGPSCRRGRLLGAAARHGPLRAASGSARPGTSSTAPPTTPRSSAGCWRTRRTTTSRGHRLPGGAVHGLRRRHPGRPAARPQAGAALQHATAGDRPDPAPRGGRRRPRRPGGERVGRAVGRHARLHRAYGPA